MTLRITTIRRAVQVFFLLLAVWFSVAPAIRETSGGHGGWPIRWLLELDPLVALFLRYLQAVPECPLGPTNH